MKKSKKGQSSQPTSAQNIGRELLRNRIKDDSLAGQTFVTSSTMLSSKMKDVLSKPEQQEETGLSTSLSRTLRKLKIDTMKEFSEPRGQDSKD